MRRWLSILAALVFGFFSLNCASAVAQTRALGLDVSSWQGDISQSNWNLIKADGKSFVFLRSSRGGTTGFYNQSDADNDNRLNTFSQRYDDNRFANNITRATAAGIMAGSYHFGRMDITSFDMDGQAIAQNGIDEANHMLQASGAYMKPGYLLPIFDLEAGSGIRTSEQLAQYAIAFSDRIYAVTGYRPGIYIGGNYANPMNSIPSANALVAAYPVTWNANWPTSPNITTGNPSSLTYGPWDNASNANPWHFWQYTSTGTVAGYSGPVDLDVAHGTVEYVKDHLVPALWMNDSSGAWGTVSNWNSDNRDYNAADLTKGPAPRLPGVGTSGANDTVILDRPSASITVTHGSGTTTNIRKLYVAETLNITGGSLNVNYDPTTTDAVGSGTTVLGSWAPGTWNSQVAAEFNGLVTLSGTGGLSVQKLQVDALRTFTLAGGSLSFNAINLMPSASTPGKIAITGDVSITPLQNSQGNDTATIANGSGSGTGGTVDLGNATRNITVNDGPSSTDLLVSVPITGTGGGLHKSGMGAMSLSAVNTFTGPVIVNRGSLAISSTGTVTSASSYTIGSEGVLTLDNSGANNNNRIATAPVTINGGTLNFVGNTSTEVTGDFVAARGASSIVLSGSGTSTLAFGSFARSAGATVNFMGADNTHRATFTSGVVDDSFIDQGTFVDGADYAVYNAGTNYVRAMVAGAGANDYATTVAANRHVKLSSTESGVSDITINTLNLDGATVGLDLTSGSTLTLSNGGVIKSGGGLGTLGGSGAFLSTSAEYVFNSAAPSDELVVTASITNGTGLTKTGPGVLTLSNSGNSYAGTTSIAQGTVKIGASGVIPNSSNVVVGSLATLNMNSQSETVGGVTIYDGTIGSAGTLTLNGASSTVTYSGTSFGGTISTTTLALGIGAGTTTFDVADGAAATDLTISSAVADGTGSHGINKVGTGTLHLSGTNSFTGALNIAAGTLSVSSINATATANQPLGNSSAAITLGGASAVTLQYTGVANTTLNRAIVVGGVGGGIVRATAGTLTIGTGGISGGGNGVTFDTAGGNITVTSAISGTDTTVTKVGSGTLTLSGTNTYTSNTIIKEGVLAYNSSSGNLGASSNSIVFDGGTLRNLSTVLGEARNITLNAGGGTLDNNNLSPLFSGVISGAGDLTLVGTGVTTLSNTNTYTGATNINAGRLHVTGSLASGTVKVNSSGTLSGNGAVLGDAQVNGTGIINMSGGGNIAGTLTAYGGAWSGNAPVAGLASVVGGSFTLNSSSNLTASSGLTINGGALAGTGTVSGNVTLANNPVNYSTVNFGSGGTINGTLGMNGGTAIWAGSGSVTGMSTVSAGTLYVNGTMGGAGGLTLASGASLHGTGTVNKTLTLTGNNYLGGRIHQTAAGASSPTSATLTIGTPVTWGASNLFINGPVSTTGDTISGSLTIDSLSDSQQGYDLNYSASLGGSGTAAITTTGVLSGNGRVLKPVTITGNGIINILTPPVFPVSVTSPIASSTLTSTLTASGGFWNGVGTVIGLTTVTGGTFTIGSGANLTANGNVTVSGGTGAIAGTGTITGNVTYASGATDVFPGVIAGAGKTLTVNSSFGGTLTLTGANTYTGATTITAGTLQLGNGGTTGSIASTTGIVDNGTLAFNRSDNLSYDYVISGTGALTKLAANTLTLTAANTYTGATNISAGTLQIGNGGTTGSLSNTGTIVNSSALRFNRSDAYTYGGAISGTGTLTKLGANTLTLTGTNTYTGLTTISAGTLEIGNGGTTGSLANTGSVINSGTLVFNRSNAYSYGGAISGSGAVTKLGANTLTLTGTSSYTGSTTINGGVLEYSAIANLGSASNTIQFDGGALRPLASVVDARNMSLNAGGGTIDTNGFNSTFGGDIGGTGGLTKINTGTLTLAGTNSTFNGPLTINDGIVKVTGNNQLGTAGVTTNMTVVVSGTSGSGHGGTLQLSGNVNYNLPITIGGSGLNGVSLTPPGSIGALDNESGDNTWAGTVTLAGLGSSGTDPRQSQISSQSGTLRLTGVVQSSTFLNTGLIKTGNGDLVLGGSSPNTYSNLTRVFGGRLIIEKDGALGLTGSAANLSSNTFQLAGSQSTIAFRAPVASTGFDYNTFEVINTGGTGAPGFGQIDNLGGDNSFAGSLAFDGPVVGGAREVSIGVTSGSLNVTGGIYARGIDHMPRNFTKLGGGKLILSGSSGAATGNLEVAPLFNSTFNLSAGTTELRGPSLSEANVPGVTAWNVAAGASLLASSGLFSTETVSVAAGGQFNLSGGSTDLTTLDLTGGGSFGFTGGTLHAQTIQGSVVNQGGTLSPGFSPGNTDVMGDYTQQTGAKLDIEIGGLLAGTEFDTVNVTGNAVLGGVLDVSLLNGFTPTIGQQFTVLTAGSITNSGITLGGAAASMFSLLVGPSSVILQAGLLGDFNQDNSVDTADYVVWRKGLGTTHTPGDYDTWRTHYGEPSGSGSGTTAPQGGTVPEPAAILMLLCGLFAFAPCLRLRRRG